MSVSGRLFSARDNPQLSVGRFDKPFMINPTQRNPLSSPSTEGDQPLSPQLPEIDPAAQSVRQLSDLVAGRTALSPYVNLAWGSDQKPFDSTGRILDILTKRPGFTWTTLGSFFGVQCAFGHGNSAVGAVIAGAYFLHVGTSIAAKKISGFREVSLEKKYFKSCALLPAYEELRKHLQSPPDILKAAPQSTEEEEKQREDPTFKAYVKTTRVKMAQLVVGSHNSTQTRRHLSGLFSRSMHMNPGLRTMIR
jgi:hypothetical protein